MDVTRGGDKAGGKEGVSRGGDTASGCGMARDDVMSPPSSPTSLLTESEGSSRLSTLILFILLALPLFITILLDGLPILVKIM